MGFNINQCCSTWWAEVLKKVKKSVVFIDNAAAETFHWNGNLIDLYNAEAECVKEFTSFENADHKYKKAVFITSAYGNNIEVLKNIIESSKFEYCVLITTAHPYVLSKNRYDDENGEMQAFTLLEKEMLNWMGNMDYTVEILYFPLFMAPLTDNCFITPEFHNMFPPLKKITDSPTEIAFHLLNEDTQQSIRHLVALLHSLLGTLGFKEEIFSLGDFSAIVASMLENFPPAWARRKNISKTATVIFVDRTLDLSSALSHNTDSIIDYIKLILPKFPGHNIDVAVDMSPICKANVDNVIDDVQLAPGCLAQPQEESGRTMLDLLINGNQKKVLNEVYQNLSAKDGITVKSPSRITLQAIEKNINAFKDDCYLNNSTCACLQQTLAVINTLKSPLMPIIQLKASLEQIILQNLAASKNSTSILLQLCQIIKSRESRNLKLEDIFGLLLYVYCLAGSDITFSEMQENELLETLTSALSDWTEKTLIDKTSFAEFILSKLKLAAKTRDDLVNYKSVVHCTNKSQPAEFKGILQQLMEDLLNPSKPEMIDLASKSLGISELLKSSFSLLMNKPKKAAHPADNKCVIMFVLGGIKAQEVNLLQKLVNNSNINLLLGSTKLVTSADIVNTVLEL